MSKHTTTDLALHPNGDLTDDLAEALIGARIIRVSVTESGEEITLELDNGHAIVFTASMGYDPFPVARLTTPSQ